MAMPSTTLESSTTAAHDIFVGRQPVYDRDLKVVAYELLFRGGDTNRAVIDNPEQATSQLIVNTFIEIGLGRIVGDKTAFVNVTRDFIVGGHLFALSEHRLGIEILEDTKVDDDLMRAVRDLVDHGHIILLDDFVYHESLKPLVEVANIVKIDILGQDRAVIREHVRILRRYKVELLAEKIETPEEFEFCKELGFDYFQGFFFCKPNVIRGQRAPASRLGLMQLLAVLQAPELDFDKLESTVTRDVSISYRLLRLINSAHYGLPRRVDSIKDALVILGLRAIRNWVSLIAMSRIDGKPQELMVTALVRARMCELLAARLDRRDRDSFFTVGLLSVLDALLDQPMDEVLSSLPVSDEIRKALLGQDGLHGEMLACVLAYERGEWDRIQCKTLAKEPFGEVYVEAVDWADDVGAQLSSD